MLNEIQLRTKVDDALAPVWKEMMADRAAGDITPEQTALLDHAVAVIAKVMIEIKTQNPKVHA